MEGCQERAGGWVPLLPRLRARASPGGYAVPLGTRASLGGPAAPLRTQLSPGRPAAPL